MSRPRYADGDGEVWVGAGDIAEVLGIDPRTVTVWADKDKIPCQRALGHRRYPLHRIKAMTAALRPDAETAP